MIQYNVKWLKVLQQIIKQNEKIESGAILETSRKATLRRYHLNISEWTERVSSEKSEDSISGRETNKAKANNSKEASVAGIQRRGNLREVMVSVFISTVAKLVLQQVGWLQNPCLFHYTEPFITVTWHILTEDGTKALQTICFWKHFIQLYWLPIPIFLPCLKEKGQRLEAYVWLQLLFIYLFC